MTKAIKKLTHTVENIALCNATGCDTCPNKDTWSKLQHPQIPTCGSTKPLIYFLTKAPTLTDDKTDQYFSDKASSFIKKQIPVDFRDHVAFTGSIRCALTGRAVNINWQVQASCKKYFTEDFILDKPKILVGFGDAVLEWVLGETSISGWRGRWVPITLHGHTCWFYPIEDLNDLIRDYKTYSDPFNKALSSAKGQTLIRDLQVLFDEAETKNDPQCYPIQDVYKNIHVITNGTEFSIDQIYTALEKFNNEEAGVGIDIETNALRPYVKDAKILSIAIGTKHDVISIPLRHSQTPWDPSQLKAVEDVIVDFLYHTRCRKICYNAQFELEWFSHFYGNEILTAGQWEDAAAQSYILQNRIGSNSLNANVLHRFGLPLKSLAQTDVKNLDNEPLNQVLLYNGGDSKFTHKLFYVQEPELMAFVSERNFSGLEVYDEQLKRIPTLVLAQQRGMSVNKEIIDQYSQQLTSQIKELEAVIYNIEEVKNYEAIHGHLDLKSPTQIKVLLKDFIKDPACKIKNRDGSEKFSSAKDVLEQIDHAFTTNLMQYRRIAKLYDTYIKPLHVSEDKPSLIYPDGLIHTSFNALLTSTRRLSSSSPNLQNYPKHNDIWIRKFFVPKPGCKFVSVDYGQIEARILALLSQDQILINALWNDYDIHAEWAKRIFKLYPDIVEEKSVTDKAVFKKLRDKMKNKFVFPSCFGASIYSIAESLNVPVEIIKRLQKEFWNQLRGVRMWQRDLERFYSDHNYVENYFGFRRYAPLSYNELINAPIQGTASDIVVNAMNVLSEYAATTGQPQFQAEINVHDDLMFSMPQTSLEKDIDVVVKKMLNTYPDILTQIPITVEVSVGDNWAEMQEIGTYSSKDL